MDNIFRNQSFERATIFEWGYVHGFAQFEVRNVRFHIASLVGGGEYEAATFVKRGKRKQKTVEANHLVVIGGWSHPKLETHVVMRSERWTVEKAKFVAFSPEWDVLMDEYLLSMEPNLHLIFNGRKRQTTGCATSSRKTLSRSSPNTGITNPDDMNSMQLFAEGAAESVLINRYERDLDARRACLAHYGYTCRVCEARMSEIYGALGENYIHVHHRVPLSEVGEEYEVDPVRDLVPVCPNCHAMLHRSSTTLKVEELVEIVRNRRQAGTQAWVAPNWGPPE